MVTASANCNPNGQPNNGQCEEYGGQCSKAVDIFFNQFGNVNSQAPQFVLSYGRYCGAATKCPGSNNGKGNVQEVEACVGNPLDAACKEHDSCLDGKGNSPGSDVLDPDESCPCHAPFLGSLLAVALTPGLAPDDKLCDEDFYLPGGYASLLSSLGPGGISAEVILLAAPFCTLFVGEGDCVGLGGELEAAVLTPFCTQLVGQLNMLGNQ